jgi:uncharacterized protein
MMSGRGPAAALTGLSRSLFRPSDDASTYQYNIPGNAMMCTELKHLSSMLTSIDSTLYKDLISSANSIASEMCSTLESLIEEASSRGTGTHAGVLPYEIDGFGSEFFMDDANVPSLLALPVLGYLSPTHPVYLSTRGFVLSRQNPYFFKGSAGEGVGGPHVGYDMAWPMAIVQRAMTSQDDNEVSFETNQ